ncbi:MAG: hypothetical protein QOI28_5375 [Mycobacterium sp.]|jgi:uncharacterized protein (DUF305 family)|nr:hypothetical protein [Mycobacterium sp.]
MKSFIAALAVAAAALFLSSCSSPASDGHTGHPQGSESSASAQPAGFNDQDVEFATNMIPHHQQAVEMAALVPDRSTNPAVLKLAADISAAQGPEIETLKVFLVQWKEGTDTNPEAPETSGSPDSHGGHGGMDPMEMQGMIDAAAIANLASLKGPEFDKLWMQSMISHHEGAIEMANAEIAGGVNVDAKNLAQQIVTAQQAEINQMKQMLGG